MVGVRFSSQLYQQFSNRARNGSPRDVRYESVRKKRRLNDDIKTPEPSPFVGIGKEIHPVKGAELVFAWSGVNVQARQHDHSCSFVAENDETDRVSISDLKDTKPKKVNSVSCQTDITMCCIEELEEQLKALKATLADKSRLNREFFLEDVMKNDDSVKFYTGIPTLGCLKDGAYYCYCAYVLRISRYSSFLSVMLTNTGIFLRGLKLSGESR